MIEASIIFQVKCKPGPRVKSKGIDYNYRVPKYRLYVNDSLFTEREWRFEPNEFIEERLWINTDTNKNKLTLEPVLKYDDHYELLDFQVLKHIQGNEWDIDKDSHSQKDLEIIFKV
jgi:hypothetical protein